MFTLQMKHLQQSNNPLNIKFMGKFVKLLDEEGETIFVRSKDIKKVRDFGNERERRSIEVNDELIDVVRINDTEVNSLDDIMCIIDPVE